MLNHNRLSVDARHELVKAIFAWHQFVELSKEYDNTAAIHELQAAGLVKDPLNQFTVCHEMTLEGGLIAFWLAGCKPLLLLESVKGACP